jgi:hypothetical protein
MLCGCAVALLRGLQCFAIAIKDAYYYLAGLHCGYY